MGLFKRAGFLIGFAIFIFLLSRVKIGEVAGLLSSTKPDFYFGALLLLALLLLLKGLKWKLVLRAQGVSLGLPEAVKYFCVGFFFSSFTPAKLGDFVRALYISGGAKLPLALGSVLVDRAIDVALLFIFAVFATVAAYFWLGSQMVPFWLLILLSAILAASFYLLFNEHYLKILLRPMFRAIVPENHKAGLSAGFSELFSSVKTVLNRKRVFAGAILVGTLSWVISILFAYLVMLSLGIGLPLAAMFLIYPIVTLADLLPISISGVGTRDAILIFFFSVLSMPPEQAVAFSLLLFFTGYLLVATIGYAFFLSRPVDIKNTLWGNS